MKEIEVDRRCPWALHFGDYMQQYFVYIILYTILPIILNEFCFYFL